MKAKYSDLVYTDRLKIERFIKKLTIRDMSKLMGYRSPSTYTNIEKGIVQPKIKDMNKISEILGQPVEYFFKLNVQETQTNLCNINKIISTL